jgi:poly-beta-1,6-N-acetyl-D-glucosamine synthase
MLFLIFWSYCGYLLLLVLISTLNPRRQGPIQRPSKLPMLAVVVPCYNEEDYIQTKIQNLKELEYDKQRLLVYFVDAQSSDGTRELIAQETKGDSNWRLLKAPARGKIHQLNFCLAGLPNDVEIVLSTDADALLPTDTLIQVASEFDSDHRLGVVGASVLLLPATLLDGPSSTTFPTIALRTISMSLLKQTPTVIG